LNETQLKHTNLKMGQKESIFFSYQEEGESADNIPLKIDLVEGAKDSIVRKMSDEIFEGQSPSPLPF
jgi:hypothetical protein